MEKAQKARLNAGVGAVAGLLMCFITATAALAQSDSATGSLSKDCRMAGVTVSLDRPLPNTLKALKERKRLKILTIGASSSGGSDETSESYSETIEVALEKKLTDLDVQIIDRGVSGELARDAASRLQNEVALNQPDLVLWQTGTNDALARIPVDDFAQSLTEGIQWLKEHNVDVVLVGQHYIRVLRKDEHYQAVRTALAQVADAEKVLRISRYEAIETADRMYRGDAPPNEFALTEDGYSCLAEYVVRAITSAVAVGRRSSSSRR